MKFTARVEGYAGTKEYDNIFRFVKTIESFLKDGETIKFTLFDIKETKETEVNKMEDKPEKSKEELILEALEKTNIDWISAPGLDNIISDDLCISLKRLYYFLKILRDENSLYYKKDEKGTWVYRSRSKKVVGEEIESIKVEKECDPKIRDFVNDIDIENKESTKILIKLYKSNRLNYKGERALIERLINEKKEND